MTENPWQTALVAAITAGLVTYLLEYLAKPWLEVRKARILDEARAYREIQSDLKRLFMLTAAPRQRQLVEFAPGRVAEDLLESRAKIQHLQSQLAYIRPETIPSDAMDLLTFVTGVMDARCVLGLAALNEAKSPEEQQDAMCIEPEYEEWLSAVADYLITPRTKPVGRIYHRRRIAQAHRAMIEESQRWTAEGFPPAGSRADEQHV